MGATQLELYGEHKSHTAPTWFHLGRWTPKCQTLRVLQGRHPLGAPLGSVESQCKSCVHLTYDDSFKRRYYKCAQSCQTRGTATDVKLKWRGCALWKGREINGDAT